MGAALLEGAPVVSHRKPNSERQRAVAAETLRQIRTTHGVSKHDLYWIWQGMIRRCRDRRAYWSFGITVDRRWYDIGKFIDDIEAELGPRPSREWSLDRVDNDQGYKPGNVRWAAPKTQAQNRGHSELAREKAQLRAAAMDCLCDWERRLSCCCDAACRWRTAEAVPASPPA
jgi:hypothetical protein